MMGISCACDYGLDDCSWYYEVHDEAKVYDWKRARKCCSCKAKLRPGTKAHCINRWRAPVSEVEENIYGEGGEVYLADWWFCERCYAIYAAFERVKVCVDLTSDLREDLAEFNRDYAPRGFRLKVAGMEGDS